MSGHRDLSGSPQSIGTFSFVLSMSLHEVTRKIRTNLFSGMDSRWNSDFHPTQVAGPDLFTLGAVLNFIPCFSFYGVLSGIWGNIRAILINLDIRIVLFIRREETMSRSIIGKKRGSRKSRTGRTLATETELRFLTGRTRRRTRRGFNHSVDRRDRTSINGNGRASKEVGEERQVWATV